MIGAVLEGIDMLIDGPYVEALASSAGPWTGSANQRVIDMVATRLTHGVKLDSQMAGGPHLANPKARLLEK